MTEHTTRRTKLCQDCQVVPIAKNNKRCLACHTAFRRSRPGARPRQALCACGKRCNRKSLEVGNFIILESALSFLGLGISPPTPSWGNMLTAFQTYMRIAPWVTLFPGSMIFFTVLSINFVGDGLRDALDPYLKDR